MYTKSLGRVDMEKDIKQLIEKIDTLQASVDKLDEKLTKHIGFIDTTYEGLRSPISAAKRLLGR